MFSNLTVHFDCIASKWNARVQLSIWHFKMNTEQKKRTTKRKKEDKRAVGFVCCRFTASFRFFSEVANHICSRCWVEKSVQEIIFFGLCVCLFVYLFRVEFDVCASVSEHALFFISLALFCRFLFGVHELGNHVFGTLILAFAIGIYASMYVSFAHDKGPKLPISASKYSPYIYFFLVCMGMWKCFPTQCIHTYSHTAYTSGSICKYHSNSF